MSLINDVKQDLFTLKGLGITLITNLIIIGALGSWIFINVQVLGNDVAISVPSKSSFSKH